MPANFGISPKREKRSPGQPRGVRRAGGVPRARARPCQPPAAGPRAAAGHRASSGVVTLKRKDAQPAPCQISHPLCTSPVHFFGEKAVPALSSQAVFSMPLFNLYIFNFCKPTSKALAGSRWTFSSDNFERQFYFYLGCSHQVCLEQRAPHPPKANKKPTASALPL